jgi:hypothetical protein
VKRNVTVPSGGLAGLTFDSEPVIMATSTHRVRLSESVWTR